MRVMLRQGNRRQVECELDRYPFAGDILELTIGSFTGRFLIREVFPPDPLTGPDVDLLVYVKALPTERFKLYRSRGED